MSETSIYLSIIVPAYNEEARLPSTLEQICAYLSTQSYTYEVIVVENNSQDRTLEIAKEFAKRYPFILAIHENSRGKGLAIQRGMLLAKGKYRFMCDADLSMPIEELPRFLSPDMSTADIVIGSREAAGAQRFDEPTSRHLGGRLINYVIQLLALPGLQDTQCGFKLFTAEVAEDLFSVQTLMGWSFDIELLFVARRRGYNIKEIGIPWKYYAFSHVSPIRDAVRMVLDILKIHGNSLMGVYKRKPQSPTSK